MAKKAKPRKITTKWQRARVRRLSNGRLHVHVLGAARKRKTNPKRKRKARK